MSTKTETVNSKVETLDINLDEIFDAAPSGADVTLPEEKPHKNIFSDLNKKSDLSFADPDKDDKDDLNAKVEEKKEEAKTEEQKETVEAVEEKEEKPQEKEKVDIDEVINSIDEVSEEDEKKETRCRKKISGISDVFSKLIKDDKIVPFDDDKPLEEYTAKDWEELVEANLEERARQVRKETPKQFFESLPKELQIAARYVADGGQDLKGLFSTLSQVEESKTLDVKKSSDQERIITEYLSATGYGTTEEIAEEIEIWKDLGKLEQQALKFKPKLDKMQEKVVA